MLLEWDASIFHLINSGLQNPFLDAIMPLWRSKLLWIPFYLFIASFLVLNFRKKGFLLLLGIGLTVGVADYTSSTILKKNVQRLRPCKTEIVKEEMNLLINCGAGYSFPSSHATNHFAIAVLLFFTVGRVFRKLKVPILLWAASIAFGQVYVGVHFPIDVLFGAILGSCIGLVGVFLLQRFLRFREWLRVDLNHGDF